MDMATISSAWQSTLPLRLQEARPSISVIRSGCDCPRVLGWSSARRRKMASAGSSARSLFSALLLCFLLVAAVVAQNTYICYESSPRGDVQNLGYFKREVFDEVLPGQGITIGNLAADSFYTLYFDSWNETDANPCAWVGVTCNANSTVEELDFSNWGIFLDNIESFASLCCLEGLRHLDLSSNQGQPGAISEDINTCTGLTYLDLSRNLLTGSIPNISGLQSLRYISLEQNMLEGEVPSLQGLMNLQFLLLADNNLGGPIPTDLGKINTLISIDLSNNSFNGTIPSLSGLTNLLDLSLDTNNFTKFEEPVFPNAKSLKYLSVSGNQLEGIIPPSITNIPNLELLDMSQNQLSGEIPLGLSQNNQTIFKLDLSQNQLTGSIPTDLLRPSYVYYLHINLSHNLLTGSIPVVSNATKNPVPLYLELDLSHNYLSGPVPFIYYSIVLTSLSLQNNSLSGDIVSVLLENQSIFYAVQVQLQNNFFTGDLLRLVSNCSKLLGLNILDLSNNNLQWSRTNAIPDPLRVMVESCAFHELRVGGNNLSGISLPSALNISESFNVFPTDSHHSLLQVLDLSNSHITGTISDAVFNSTWFPTLEVLNLSNNEIRGPIPGNIVMLPSLSDLNVSNNNLSGPLPIIQSSSRLYNPSFFMGNDGLCGEPLPPCTTPQRIAVPWWVAIIIVGGSVILVVGSCLVAAWRWRVYRIMHEQDADLIKTLLEGESATIISLRELKKATDNFAKSAQIGEGGFGTVYKGQLNDGTIVAIKRSKREGMEKDKDQFLNEVRILSQVNHRNLVQLLGCCMENKTAVLVFEFISNGTLQEHLRERIGEAYLSWQQRLKIATQTADALNYLHSAATIPIYHRDVKSANILLDENLNAKVADFGISKLAPVEATHVSTIAIGTMGYIDPEYYTSFKLSDRSDVYSFGVVLLELISAKSVIDFDRVEEEVSLVNFANPLIKSGDLQKLVDPSLMKTYNDITDLGRESILKVGRLARKCLNMSSKARPSMNEVSKELQFLMLDPHNPSSHLDVINGDENEGLQHDKIELFTKYFSSSRSNSMTEVDTRSIEMSQYLP